MPQVTCPDCNEARAKLWHGGYRMACTGCSARAVARSLAAFDALDPAGSGDKDALRDLITRVLPSTPYKHAREAVWAWWEQDHATEGATTA